MNNVSTHAEKMKMNLRRKKHDKELLAGTEYPSIHLFSIQYNLKTNTTFSISNFSTFVLAVSHQGAIICSNNNSVDMWIRSGVWPVFLLLLRNQVKVCDELLANTEHGKDNFYFFILNSLKGQKRLAGGRQQRPLMNRGNEDEGVGSLTGFTHRRQQHLECVC